MTIKRVLVGLAAAAAAAAALALGPSVYCDMRAPAQTISYAEAFSHPYAAPTDEPDTYFDM